MKRTILHIIIAIGALFPFSFSAGAEPARYIPEIIKIQDEEEVTDLVNNGVGILRRRGDLLLCLIPADGDGNVQIPNGEKPRRVPGMRDDLPGHFNVPTLDVARTYFNAFESLEGIGFPQAYTGKGVVAGICDMGFDPLHPTFLDADGNPRVKRLVQYKEREGLRLEMESAKEYEEWVTDNDSEYHATHVCGIMAGNGAGSPYSGIASDADIVMTVSQLSDVGLLAGVEDIIDYAKEVGKPAVINLSMGNYIGAHDGTSLFSQYIARCAEDAIIVLSAGNEGRNANTMRFDFTESKMDVGFMLGNRGWNQRNMYGVTEAWSMSRNPLSIEISIFNEETGKIDFTYPAFTLEDDERALLQWNPEDPDYDGCGLNGYLMVEGGVDPDNGRYVARMMYDFASEVLTPGRWARDLVAVKVTGEPGESVDIFADGSYTRLIQRSGYPAPGSDMSISDLVCGEGVISVGMYGNRGEKPVSVFDEETGTFSTEMLPTGFVAGRISDYSSYGTLRDGRVLPLTVAPGGPLVSACSRAYVAADPKREHYLLDGIPWAAQSGTSMSSPYVSGFIATWLEALPGLTKEDVERAISCTNRTDIADIDDPRSGNGWFDPVAALRFLLRENGIEDVKDPVHLLDPEDEIIVHTLSGIKIHEGKAGSLSDLPSGVYIVRTPFGTAKWAGGGRLLQ